MTIVDFQTLFSIYLALLADYLSIPMLTPIARMLHCSTCLLDTDFRLRLTPITLPAITQDVVPFKTIYSHSNNHYHHQNCIAHIARLLFNKTLYSTYQCSQSQDTKALSSSSAYCYVSLEYHTWSIPNCTQPRSLSVDALPAYCSIMRLCLILHLKILQTSSIVHLPDVCR